MLSRARVYARQRALARSACRRRRAACRLMTASAIAKLETAASGSRGRGWRGEWRVEWGVGVWRGNQNKINCLIHAYGPRSQLSSALTALTALSSLLTATALN